MELAISGQPIMLKVDDFGRASEEEKESVMETARIEYIRRIHGQPCCNSTVTALAPSEELFINPQEVADYIATKDKESLPFETALYDEASAILNNKAMFHNSEYMLQVISKDAENDDFCPASELENWDGFFPGPVPSKKHPGKLTKPDERLFDIPKGKHDDRLNRGFDKHRGTPALEMAYERQIIMQMKEFPEFPDQSMDYLTKCTGVSVDQWKIGWETVSTRKRREIELQCIDAENVMNNHEKDCQTVLSKVLSPERNSVTMENMKAALKVLKVIHLDLSLVRCRLVQQLLKYGQDYLSDDSKATEGYSAFCVTVIKPVDQEIGISIVETDEGIMVSRVLQHSASGKAGVQAGYILVKINGNKCPKDKEKATEILAKLKSNNIAMLCFVTKKAPHVV